MSDTLNPAIPVSVPMPVLFAADTPPQWLAFVGRRPHAIAETADSVQLRQAHLDRLRELAIIGRRAYAHDPKGNDHWDDEAPFVDGIQTPGFDCENLALWVRRVMAEEFDDWPLGCGRPTLCRLPDGQNHCVLTIVTKENGDVVVGAQHEEHAVPWRDLEGYRWFMRLEAGNDWRMVSVAAETS